jgi:hypothetical protein
MVLTVTIPPRIVQKLTPAVFTVTIIHTHVWSACIGVHRQEFQMQRPKVVASSSSLQPQKHHYDIHHPRRKMKRPVVSFVVGALTVLTSLLLLLMFRFLLQLPGKTVRRNWKHSGARHNISIPEISSSSSLYLESMHHSGRSKQQHDHEDAEIDDASADNESEACACAKADGILFISRVIRKAGAGTMFFQSIVDSLLYAEKYNLVPYIWINDDENQPCYDHAVHGIASNNRTARKKVGSITNLKGEGGMACETEEGTRPGPPSYTNLQPQTYTLIGNGLWQSYFEPIPMISSLPHHVPLSFHQPHSNSGTTDPSCAVACSQKPVFEMTRSQVMPDMHRCSEFAVRGWAFRGIPKALLPKYYENSDKEKSGKIDDRNQPTTSVMADWLWNHRQRAAPIVQRYFHLQPWLQERVELANPTLRSSNPMGATEKHYSSLASRQSRSCCLAAHIRLTDKASGRDKKGLEAYRPYIEAFAKATAFLPKEERESLLPFIYIATDDASVLPTIQKEWKIVSNRVRFQPDTYRSQEEHLPTFKLLAHDKHRSNTEALVDIYAMSKCCYFVHGYSGMSEAVVYINPKLHALSVNIDDDERMTPKEFEHLVMRTTETK